MRVGDGTPANSLEYRGNEWHCGDAAVRTLNTGEAAMNLPLFVIIIIGTAAAVSAGIVFTVRGFKASAARATGAEKDAHDTADAAPAISRHDHATTELLKRFFDGKECAICKRPIPPVHRTGLKPGLLNPATHETYSWDQIPHENLAAALETQLPLCSGCVVAESFRKRFPDLVVDRRDLGASS